ncbi:MAG: DMT family transporter [Candidatus Hadarchaeales archaeon]
MDLTGFSFALLAAFFWAASQVFGKLAIEYLAPLTFNTIRYASAFLVSVPLLHFTVGIGAYALPLLFTAFLTAVIGWYVGGQLYFVAMRSSPAHLVIPAGNSYPFWSIIMAAAFLGESVGWASPLAACMILGGSVLLLRSDGKEDGWRKGVVISMFVAIIWGIKSVLNKFTIAAGMSPSDLMLYMLVAATFLFSSSLAVVSPRGSRINRRSVSLALASGILAFPAGEMLYLKAMELERVAALTPLMSTTILFGFILSVLMVRERPTIRAVIGMILVFAGVLVAAGG